MMLSYPLLVEEVSDFFRLKLADGKVINFYSIVPLYEEEMNYKLRKGAEELLDLFDKNSINELLDVSRKNVCKKRFGLF